MRRTNRACPVALAVALLGVGVVASPVAAAVVQTTATQNTPFAVAAGDLASGVTPTATGDVSAVTEGMPAALVGTNDLSVLTNGGFGTLGTAPTDAPHAVNVHNNAAITIPLNLSVNTLGYRLTGINSYSAWQDGGRDAQQYTVAFSTVAAPGVFTDIATVNYNPAGSSPVGNEVRLTEDLTGTLATNVAAVRFSFGLVENGHVGYREFDLIGTAVPVPEPAGLGLLGVAGVGLVARRRRLA